MMNLKPTLLFTLMLALLSLSSIAEELVSLDKLVQRPSLGSVSINPQGNLLLTQGYPDDNLTINVIDIASSQTHQIFKAKTGRKIRLRRSFWLDESAVYFQTFQEKNGHLSNFKHWIVTITTGNKLSSKINAIHANGYIIDPLVEQKGQVLFATFQGKTKKRLKIFQANIDSLIRNNFRNQIEFDELLDDARGYRTDNKHTIRFSRTYDKKTLKVTQWLLNSQGEWQEIYHHNPLDVTFTPIDFIASGKLAVLTNMESDLTGLYEFDINTGTLGKELYQHHQYDLIDAEIDPTSNEVNSVSYVEHGKWQTEYFHDHNQAIDKLVENTFENQQYSMHSSSSNEQHLVLNIFASNNRGSFYYYDKNNNKAHLIGDRYPEDKNYHFQTKTPHSITSSEGHQIEAYLTEPTRSTDNNVLLVMPHGGPIGVRDSDTFSVDVQYLVSRGYSVLQINYSGSEGFGKAHLTRGRGQFGQVIEQDISQVVDYIQQQYHFDKTCAIGSSYGGYSSVMLAIKHPNLYSCVVARFGVFDLPLMFNDRNSKDEHQIKRWEQVVGKNNPEHLKKHSPVYLAEQLKTPVLITAGMLDTQASFEHSNRLKLALTVLNKSMESIFYKKSAHGHRDIKSFQHELAAIDEYIRRQLSLDLPQNENAKTIVRGEYQRLAQGFKNNNILALDNERAERFIEKKKALNIKQ